MKFNNTPIQNGGFKIIIFKNNITRNNIALEYYVYFYQFISDLNKFNSLNKKISVLI